MVFGIASYPSLLAGWFRFEALHLISMEFSLVIIVFVYNFFAMTWL
jgi:hypothetical protein